MLAHGPFGFCPIELAAILSGFSGLWVTRFTLWPFFKKVFGYDRFKSE